MKKQNRWVLPVAAAVLGFVAGVAAFSHFLWWNHSEITDRWIAALFHRMYHRNGAQTYNNTFWMGVPVQKLPLDLWIYQEILQETKPDVIVEAGTYKGGSSFYFASLQDLMKHGRVLTIDIEDYPGKPSHDRVKFFLGSSTGKDALDWVKSSISPGERVMVALDSDHSKEHVLNELRMYSPLVSLGCYLVVEDTHFNGHPILSGHGPGPMEAVEEFLRENKDFVVDRSREKFHVSFNYKGYLKRVR